MPAPSDRSSAPGVRDAGHADAPDAAASPAGAGPSVPPEAGTASPEEDAVALWLEAPGTYALRREPVAGGPGLVRLTTLCTAVSRGTERLVMEGRVPASEHERMACPHQAGDFAFPVKYGYALVGRDGGGALSFCLHPHQSAVAVPAHCLFAVPPGIPPHRAALAANMETALNVVWDAGVGPCDRVLVVGAGVVGLMIARLLARIPGVEVWVADIVPRRRAVAEALGARFVDPADAPADVDVAINASASAAGLDACIAAAGPEARVVEASWHGTGASPVALGGAFHARRLTLVSSQVGRVPPARAPRWTTARRLAAALALLADDALDRLVTDIVPLAEAPARLPGLLTGADALAIVIDYGA